MKSFGNCFAFTYSDLTADGPTESRPTALTCRFILEVVTLADGNQQNLDLRDDGLDGDTTAADATWSGWFADTPRAGNKKKAFEIFELLTVANASVPLLILCDRRNLFWRFLAKQGA